MAQPNAAGTLAILARQKAARASAALALGVSPQPAGVAPIKRVVPPKPATLEPPEAQDVLLHVKEFLSGLNARPASSPKG